MGYLLLMRTLLLITLLLTGCDGLRAWVIRHWPQDYAPSPAPEVASGAGAVGTDWPPGVPFIDGPDEGLEPISVALELVVEGLNQPTDIQFPPGATTEALVLEKEGRAVWVDLSAGTQTTMAQLRVLTKSEQGLLGGAFHPDFGSNGYLYLNHSAETDTGAVSVVSHWQVDSATRKARHIAEVLRVPQPYANHNAGQLAFGPDGMLYIGWGDGGWRGDPHGHGQNPQTWLGSMLRIDVDRKDPDKGYAVPPDNPWVDSTGGAPEVWAIGLRNPWRYSFAPDGRLVVADVGQDAWEEVAIVAKGENHGWNIQEGRHCYQPAEGCDAAGLVPPVYEYDHKSGESITGGFVYTGTQIPALNGSYVFGDFVSGRIWAIRLPGPDGWQATDKVALGRWTMLPSTFGQDAAGEIYVADYGKGRIYRLSSPGPASGSP